MQAESLATALVGSISRNPLPNNDFEDNYIPKVLLLCTKDSFHLENVQDKYCSTHMLEKQQMEQKYIDNAALQQEEPALTNKHAF